jgi:hypothetical protein
MLEAGRLSRLNVMTHDNDGHIVAHDLIALQTALLILLRHTYEQVETKGGSVEEYANWYSTWGDTQSYSTELVGLLRQTVGALVLPDAIYGNGHWRGCIMAGVNSKKAGQTNLCTVTIGGEKYAWNNGMRTRDLLAVGMSINKSSAPRTSFYGYTDKCQMEKCFFVVSGLPRSRWWAWPHIIAALLGRPMDVVSLNNKPLQPTADNGGNGNKNSHPDYKMAGTPPGSSVSRYKTPKELEVRSIVNTGRRHRSAVQVKSSNEHPTRLPGSNPRRGSLSEGWPATPIDPLSCQEWATDADQPQSFSAIEETTRMSALVGSLYNRWARMKDTEILHLSEEFKRTSIVLVCASVSTSAPVMSWE